MSQMEAILYSVIFLVGSAILGGLLVYFNMKKTYNQLLDTHNTTVAEYDAYKEVSERRISELNSERVLLLGKITGLENEIQKYIDAAKTGKTKS
jgi:hypothetical protein